MAIANSPRQAEHGPVLEATEARSGRPGVHVLWILGLSTALAAIVLFILLAIAAPGLSGPGGQVAARAPAASQPPAQPRQADPAHP